ncbi:energy transducer TonB [Haliscomenobacter hydrossis]|uniref:TonB family protein n=1 Tax=Haliscomenobacter hydrossis (strain ATCC 27775 / DSM 1100 / LMG 10767 / O) TaxID=760192 RepID=F4L060_HALH1|nr:energy transducer TonB [Haliscomenobacter hydrossis]AEE52769.1 TonB family protein [Haliscomenobacter hydrossis DSM 1100]
MRKFFLLLAFAFSLFYPLSKGQDFIPLLPESYARSCSCQPIHQEVSRDSLNIDLAAGQHPPRFEDWDNYVKGKSIYPQLARENGIEGTVSVLVYVSEKGQVTKARLLKGLGFGCDEAAINLVYAMPCWTPASNYGIPVKGKKVLDISFRLTHE